MIACCNLFVDLTRVDCLHSSNYLQGSQVDDSGHRILQENTGNRWNMEAVFRPEIVWIFSGGFLSTSCAFRPEIIGKNPKNFQPEYCFHKITVITRNR
jgi:hypothetical protein